MDSKKRATNFSSVEEALLVELVKKYRNIIECKKSDTNSLRMKTETWMNIAKEFNSLSGEVYREAKILKSKYENLKKRAKYKFAEEKSYQLSTGGGPSQDFRIDPIDTSIKELIETQITGFNSTFDDDSDITVTPIMFDNEVIETEVIDNQSAAAAAAIDHCYMADKVINDNGSGASSSTVAVDHCYIEEKKKNDWGKYTPQMLRTPKSTPLQTTDSSARNHGKRLPFIKNPLSRKMVTWAESKVELAEIQKKCYLEQHQLKMQLMQEEHEEKLRLLKYESEIRIEIMEQSKKLDI